MKPFDGSEQNIHILIVKGNNSEQHFSKLRILVLQRIKIPISLRTEYIEWHAEEIVMAEFTTRFDLDELLLDTENWQQWTFFKNLV